MMLRKNITSDYQDLWTHEDVVSAYTEKFESPLERLRHKYELSFLKKYCRGHIFDGSIATGRFIPELIKKHKISGMDFSSKFVQHISLTFPTVHVTQGDLRESIAQESGKYDTVMCFRTLFALPNPKAIIKEFKRICAPDGLIIFDFPSKAKSAIRPDLSLDSDWPDFFLEDLGLEVIEHKRADMFFSALKPGANAKRLPRLLKKYKKAKLNGNVQEKNSLLKKISTQKKAIRLYRTFSMLEKFLPDWFFISYENLCRHSRRLTRRERSVWWNREFFVCRFKS